MKISGRNADDITRHPPPELRVILLFGPDQGLALERANTITRAIVGSVDDPFSVVNVALSDIRSTPSLLADERAAIGFSGRRVIRVADATDSITSAVETALTQPAGDGLIVLTAGELSPRAKLRKLCEDHDHAAAIGCYPDDARSLNDLIQRVVREAGLTISQEAHAYVAAHLGSDRGVSRQELEKLTLFSMGSPKKEVTLEDVQAIIGDSGATAIDLVLLATLEGHLPKLDRTLSKAYQEGINPIQILRGLQRCFHRLHLASEDVVNGRSPEQAIGSLRPPVIFKDKPGHIRGLTRWSKTHIENTLQMLSEAEVACKGGKAQPETTCHRTLLRIAASRG